MLGHVKLIIWFSDTDFQKNEEGRRVFNFCIYMHIGPIFRLLPFGITGSNDFVQSEENTRVFRIPST